LRGVAAGVEGYLPFLGDHGEFAVRFQARAVGLQARAFAAQQGGIDGGDDVAGVDEVALVDGDGHEEAAALEREVGRAGGLEATDIAVFHFVAPHLGDGDGGDGHGGLGRARFVHVGVGADRHGAADEGTCEQTRDDEDDEHREEAFGGAACAAMNPFSDRAPHGEPPSSRPARVPTSCKL